MPEPALKKVAVRRVSGKDGFQITIFSNIEAQKKNLLRFTAIGVERATYRALNKAGAKANTVLKRDISKSYNLAQKEFAANLKQIKGGPGRLQYQIRGTGRQIPIIKVKGAKKQTPLGVRINTGSGARVLRGHFIATMPSGHTGVFIRKSGAKHKPRRNLTTGKLQYHALGITERKFPSIAHMVSNNERGVRVFAFVRREYPIQLKRQLDAEADRLGASLVGGVPFKGALR